MEPEFDTVIAGGGLVGGTLAVALASAGLRVALVEPVPRPVRRNAAFDGRAYALAHGTVRMLQALGLWEPVADRAQPILDIEVADGGGPAGAPSPFGLHFDHAELEEGPMGQLVEDRHLRRAVLDRVKDAERVSEITGRTIVAQAPDAGGVSITLDDGRALRARVLIGTDGKASGTAARAGLKRTGWRYGQTALVCALSHERPHNGTARQVFFPGGPLALLPLRGNRVSIVWTERDEEAARIAALSPADYLAVLRPRLGDTLGAVRLAGARYTYPLQLSLANRMVAERVALAGDAAHVVHPLAGQGLNAGLRDVAALAEVLAEARRRGEDIGRADVLERYQVWRRFDVATLALATDAFNRLFSNDSAVLRLGRQVGLAAVSRLPALRRGFMREAAGLTGELPRLMRGRAL